MNTKTITVYALEDWSTVLPHLLGHRCSLALFDPSLWSAYRRKLSMPEPLPVLFC